MGFKVKHVWQDPQNMAHMASLIVLESTVYRLHVLRAFPAGLWHHHRARRRRRRCLTSISQARNLHHGTSYGTSMCERAACTKIRMNGLCCGHRTCLRCAGERQNRMHCTCVHVDAHAPTSASTCAECVLVRLLLLNLVSLLVWAGVPA